MSGNSKLKALLANKIVPLVMMFSLLTTDAFAAYFYFKDNQNLMKGCPGTVEIGLNTEGAKVLAADAVMYFQVAQATVQSLGLGTILPMPTFNHILGQRLSVSGARFPQTGTFSGDGVFGKINLTPSLTASTLSLTFSADLVNDIIIAEDGTFANVAKNGVNKDFAVKERFNANIEGGFCTADTTPPNVEFILPANGAVGVPVDTNVIFSLSDSRAGVNINTLRYTIKGINYSNTSPQTTITQSAGVFRAETKPDTHFLQGERVEISVDICDLNVPANCGNSKAHFIAYTPPAPDPVCGDGIVSYEAGEQCDGQPGCSDLCLWEIPEPEIIIQEAPPAEECPVCPECPVCEAPVQPDYLRPSALEMMEDEEWWYEEFAAPEIMESIAGCTREDVIKEVMEKFEITERYAKFDAACRADIEHCMLPFLIHTAYKDVDLQAGRYYPDVLLEKESGDRVFLQGEGAVTQEIKNAINFSTRTGMVQGYYADIVNLSPFRPKYNMRRMEVVKLLNWAALGQQWQYEEEFWASIGGKANWPNIKKTFSDLTEWWYPRYINLACEKGIIECNPSIAFGPQEVCSPTWKRDIMARYLVYYKQQGEADVFKDSDGDGLSDREEIYVFNTDPNKKDTDGDGLTDYEEIHTFGTNPLLADTDGDGLSDYDEIHKHKTNPLKRDTDGDGFDDGIEVRLGSDPNNPNSIPNDLNGNGIDDEWERKYGISPADGTVDTDGDGLTDLMEYRYGTDPTNPDTDGDGLTDGEEVLMYGTDPLVPNTLADIGVRIINLHDGMTLTDLRPFIQGVGPTPGMEISIVLRNEFGHEIELGKTILDAKRAFTLSPGFDLRDGEFFLLAKGYDERNKRVITSPLIQLTLNSALQIDAPRPERISNVTLTDDVVLEGVRIEINDNVPLLVGRTGYQNRVFATWESIIGSSAVVADLAGGEFRIRAPEPLDYGPHKVTLFSVREADQAMSKSVVLHFEIREPFTQVLHGIAFGEELIFPNYVWVMIFVLGIALVIYGVKAGKYMKKRK